MVGSILLDYVGWTYPFYCIGQFLVMTMIIILILIIITTTIIIIIIVITF